MKEKAFVSVIVYIYNNSDNICHLLSSLDTYLNSFFEDFEIICVNDASTDESLTEVKRCCSALNRDITMVNLAWKHGCDRGIISGIDLSIGDFIVEIEAGKIDYDFSLISTLYIEASTGFDIVSAERTEIPGFSDRLFYVIFNRLSYLPFELNQEMIRIISRRTANSLLSMNERVVSRDILYGFTGFPRKSITYIPVSDRKVKNRPFREKLSIAIETIISYSNIGPNLSIIIAAVFLIFSFLLGIYALIVYFTWKEVVPGWTSTALFLSIGFTGIFLVLGIQGRYISSLLLDIKQRPRYIVRSIDRYKNR
jgi:polyisoprenyl-phosphate glycosyltransferase